MGKPASYQLFVYGSLRQGFHHPAYQYIRQYFEFLGPARVKGLLYDMGDYPAALPTAEDRFIIGELYVLKNEDEFGWAMAQLDDYEGVNPEAGQLALYRRDLAEVYAGSVVTGAWIYWYNSGVEGRPIIASGDVLEYRQAKNHF